MFSCRSCNNTDFTVEQMKKEKYLLSNRRGICKPCASNYNAVNTRLMKAKKNPKNFLTCDDCDGIFSKYKVGTPFTRDGIVQKLKIDCPFCKSENIDRY